MSPSETTGLRRQIHPRRQSALVEGPGKWSSSSLGNGQPRAEERGVAHRPQQMKQPRGVCAGEGLTITRAPAGGGK